MAHLSVLIIRNGYVKLHMLKLHACACTFSQMSARGTGHIRVSSMDCTDISVLVLLVCCAGGSDGGGKVKCITLDLGSSFKGLFKVHAQNVFALEMYFAPIPSLDKRVSYYLTILHLTFFFT